MTSDSTTRWPLLEERRPFATASQGRDSRRLSRLAWLLIGLAFLCGGLVSAAGFSIGWRHQAQRDSATQTALAAATARTHRLERSIAALRASLGEARGAAKAATASEQALGRAGVKVGEEATVANGNGVAISSSAGTLSASATRIASELKTLATYLTTTPTGQLDPGYIASQTSYLSRQLARLREDAGFLGGSISSFEATLRTLSREARALKRG